MSILVFEPYTNAILCPDGNVRLFDWCHGAIKRALRYYQLLYGELLTYDRLIDLRNTVSASRSLLFGASEMTVRDFEAVFPQELTRENIEDLHEMVIDGLVNYLPAAVQDVPLPDDDDWPDIEPSPEEKRQEQTDWSTWYDAMKRAGYSMAEVDRMTWRGMDAAIKRFLRQKSTVEVLTE